MAIESTPVKTGRPNPLLLIALAVLVVGYAAMKIFSGPAGSPSVPTTPAGRTQAAANGGPVDPGELDVHVEELKKPGPGLADGGRNPFAFYVPPPPPLPPAPPAPKFTPRPVETVPPDSMKPAEPTGPPPIGTVVKFIGIAETGKGKIGAFSIWDNQARECRATVPGREGDVIEGRYRVVRIGIESAVLEYLDGKGRATLPMNGQACVAK